MACGLNRERYSVHNNSHVSETIKKKVPKHNNSVGHTANVRLIQSNNY